MPAVEPRPDVSGPHERHAQRLGEHDVVGVGRVALAGGEQGQRGRAGARRVHRRVQGRAQEGHGRRRVDDAGVRSRAQGGDGGAHDLAVQQGVAEAVGGAELVADDDPRAVGGAHHVGGGQRGPGLTRPGEADGLRGPARAVRHGPPRHRAGADDLGVPVGVAATAAGRAVRVGEEGGERAVPLLDPRGDPLPLGDRHDARPRVLGERLRNLATVDPGGHHHAAAAPLGRQCGRRVGQARGPQPVQDRADGLVVGAQPPTRLDRLVGGGCGVGGQQFRTHSHRSNQAAIRPLSSTRWSRPTTVCPSPGRSSRSLGCPAGLQGLVQLHRLGDRHVGVAVPVRQQDRRGQPLDGGHRRDRGEHLAVGHRVAVLGHGGGGHPRLGAGEEGAQVAHPGQGRTGGEQVRPPGQRDQREVAAVGPAVRADPAGFGDAGGDEPLDRRPDVVERRLAGRAVVGLRERPPAATGAADVRARRP